MNNNILKYNNSTDNIPKNIECYFMGAKNSTVEIMQSDEIENGPNKLCIKIHGNGSKLYIGKNLKIRGPVRIDMCHNSNIYIGDNCLFAAEIEILSTDFHRLYDLETNELLNLTKPVIIENNCWIGRYVKILKGAHIPENSVVGLCSVVNKKFNKKNVLIAGIPARIKRENIYWKE